MKFSQPFQPDGGSDRESKIMGKQETIQKKRDRIIWTEKERDRRIDTKLVKDR